MKESKLEKATRLRHSYLIRWSVLNNIKATTPAPTSVVIQNIMDDYEKLMARQNNIIKKEKALEGRNNVTSK